MFIRIAATSVVATAIFFASSARADEHDAAYYNAAFERVGGSIGPTQTADTTRVAASELELVRTLVGQGQSLTAADKLDEADQVLTRASVVARYAAAKVQRASAEARAAEAIASASAAEQAASSVKADAAAKAKRAAELEASGL